MEIVVELNPSEVSFPHSREERALLDCHIAQQFEERGEYEEARRQLSLFWPSFAEDPDLTGLGPAARGRLLRRIGTLTGWLGRVRQMSGAQERAKDLLTRCLEIYQRLGDRLEIIETKYELALCYWREGAFDEARIIINSALTLLEAGDEYWEGKLLHRAAVIEFKAQNLQETLRLLRKAQGKIGTGDYPLLKGKLHSELGLVLRSIFLREETFAVKISVTGSDYYKQYLHFALYEYTKARALFEQASHRRYAAYVENNIGNLYLSQGRYEEAQRYLGLALRRFRELDDSGSAAQVTESMAGVYLAQGKLGKALTCARAAVEAFRRGDDRALLSEALVTLGRVYARRGQCERAGEVLRQAIETSESSGDQEGAGSATLTLLEELFDNLCADERRSMHAQAERLLRRPMNPANVKRLREVSLRI